MLSVERQARSELVVFKLDLRGSGSIANLDVAE